MPFSSLRDVLNRDRPDASAFVPPLLSVRAGRRTWNNSFPRHGILSVFATTRMSGTAGRAHAISPTGCEKPSGRRRARIYSLRSEVVDQSVLLGQPDELVGEQQPMFRMLPAQECLHGGHTAVTGTQVHIERVSQPAALGSCSRKILPLGPEDSRSRSPPIALASITTSHDHGGVRPGSR
jgi:hypothetical protein